jgi:ElaB/YqjD/DUF883 family membrane-anchored ribosome-binding protein
MSNRSRSRTRKTRKSDLSRATHSYRKKPRDLSVGSKMAQETEETEEMKAIENTLKDLRKTLDTYLPQVREQAREIQRKATKVTTERPILALGAAFLVGMTLGIVLSRARD